ncbi:MAG: type II secretion system protein [Candidatus Eremiobacteraeota bacterium]|nr:type II secretion system protein [Candidatus Eremiobacteraeota bacterium]
MLRNDRGLTLGTTLLVVMIVFILALTVVAATFSQMMVLSKDENKEQARLIAVSTANLAIEKIISDEDFGTEARSVVSYHPEGYPESTAGLVVFDPDGDPEGDETYSINNLNASNSKEGWSGRRVPKRSVHIISIGTHAGTEVKVECFLRVPPFPYAVAASGPILSLGGLTVGGLPSGAWDGGARPSLSPNDLGPGDMLSNSTSDPSITLGTQTLITGDVQAARSITTNLEETVILGEMRANADEAEIPEIDIELFEPGADAQELLPDDEGEVDYDEAVFIGYIKHHGDLQLTGGVELQGALVYVDGNLVVEGGVKGTGALIATGNLTIQGGVSELTGESEVALLAGGDLNLLGSGPAGDFFRGLLYAEGSLTVNQITLVGAAIVRGAEGVETQVNLNDLTLIHDPDAADVQVSLLGPGGSGNILTLYGVPNHVHIGNDTAGFQGGETFVVEAQGDGTVKVGGAGPFTPLEATGYIESHSAHSSSFTGDLRRKIENAVGLMAGGSGDEVDNVLTSIEPSRFYKTADRLRVMRWSEL